MWKLLMIAMKIEKSVRKKKGGTIQFVDKGKNSFKGMGEFRPSHAS